MKRTTILALALTMLLTGCGGGETTASPSDPAAPTGAQPQQEERIVHYGMSNPWDALMPYNSPSGSNYSRMVYDKIYDRLAFVHADGTVTARGAESWEGTDDGMAALFHLDQKAAFHDGEKVTAQHWADTIRMMTDPACPALGRSVFSVLAGTDESGAAVAGETLGAEALDEYTLKLSFKVPTTPEDFLLDKNREFYVLPTHLLEGTAPAEIMDLALWNAPVGSGPCRFDSEVSGSMLTLKANPDYQLGAPGFDTLAITVMDKNSLLTALIAGDLDYYAIGGSLKADTAETAEASGIEVLEGTTPNTFFELMLNNETISNASIRRGIEMALDRQLLCEQSTGGHGTITGTCVLPTCASYGGDYLVDYDPEGARALLAEGGYAGEKYHLACTSNRAGLAALIQQQLQEVGVDLVIDTVDSATMFSGMAEGIYDMGIASHTPNALPLWFVGSRFSEGNNIFHVQNVERYEAVIEKVANETDPEKRAEAVRELDELMAAERPFIPLWFGRALHAQSPTVSGIEYSAASFSNENVWEWVKQ